MQIHLYSNTAGIPPIPFRLPSRTGMLLISGLLFLLLLNGRVVYAQNTSPPENETSNDASSSGANYQEKNRSELQDILRSKINKLQDLREQKHEARQRMERKIQTATSKHETIKQDVKELQTKRKEKSEALKQVKNRIKTFEERKKILEEKQKRLSDSMETLRNELSTHVSKTVPYQTKSRRNAYGASPSTPEEDSDGRTVESLRRLLDASRNELSDSTTSELYHQRVPVSAADSPRKKHARLARIGQNTLFFITEDGKQAGYYTREDGTWRIKQASPSRFKQFRRAIDVIRGQKQPARVPLPVIIQPSQP